MEIYTCVKNCEELTETLKKEVRVMDKLSNDIYKKYCMLHTLT